MKPLRQLSTVLGLILAAGLAQAQIAPPPPPATTPTAPYSPPPPAQPGAKPTASKPKVSPAQAESMQAAEDQKAAAEIQFDSLAVKDEHGNLKPLPEPVEWCALKHNPIVKPVRLAMCEEALRERRARVESVVIDNIDLSLRLDSGLIDELDMTDKSRISEIVNLVKPFQAQGTLTNELKKKKLLEGTQAAVNTRMVTEYTNQKTGYERLKAGVAANPEKGTKPDEKVNGGPSAVDVMARVMLQMGLDESTFFFHQMLLETGPRLEKLGVSPEMAKKFADAQTEQDKIRVMKQVLEPMTLEQKRDLLKRSLEMRPPPPPLPDIDKLKAEAAAAGENGPKITPWRGPRQLIEKRMDLHKKIQATAMAEKTAKDAAAATSRPDATDETKKAAEAATVALEAAKKAEDESRQAVMALVAEHPEYKKYLSDVAARTDGTYFPADPKAPASDEKPGEKADDKTAEPDKK